MTLALVAPLADSDDVELEQRRQQQNRRRNHQRRQQRRRLPNTTMVQHGDGGGDRLLSTESAHQDKSTPPDSQFIIDTSTVVDVANACQLDNIATRPMHSNVGHSMGGGVKQQSERQQQKQQKQHQQGHGQRPRNRQRRKHKIPTTNINMQTSNSLPDDVNKKNMMQPPPLLPLEDVNNDPPTSNPQQANTKVNPRRRRIRNRNRHQHQFNTMYNTNGSEFIQDYRAESNVTTASDTNSTTDNNLETSRKDEVQNGSLASKLRYAMELEHQHRQQQLVEQQRQQSQKSSWGGGVYLTTLSSIRPPSSPSPVSTDANKDRTKIDDANHDSYEHDGEFSNRQSAATTTSATTASLTSTLDATLMIPNAKIKWTDSELSKMRHRWWEALRLKRTNATVHCDDVDRVLKSQLGASSSTREDDADDDSTFSSSSTSLDEVPSYDVCSDAIEPPSLSAPFDEGYISSGLPPTTSTTIPPPVLSNPVIDLERKCIESGCPIHCAIYNHALYHNGLRLDYFDDHHDATPTKPVKSDAEVVLHRLLTMHSIDGILRWKSMRVGLSDMRGLEGNKYPEERVNILTDATVHVLSADITSLTPLQLAVFWNLPDIIRLLCTTGVQPQTLKNSIEEDEKCRTPLMLACELGHVACIKAIMCASTFKKLDRRESEGGNSVFHFCCIGSSSSFECNQKSKDVDDDENQCAVRSSRRRDAIDVLLQYTPIKDQKIALLSTNRKGQNIFHLVCSQADVMLLQRLLEMQNLPGVNISKALDATDINGNTPFLCAIAADSTDTVMHLLTTRFATASWFAGCPLLAAVRQNSVSMVKLLLETGYDVPNRCNFRMLPGEGMLTQDEVQSALFEAIEVAVVRKEHGIANDKYEIIRLLISQGFANPHHYQTLETACVDFDEIPLLVAVRAADVDCVRCMVTTYSRTNLELNRLERNDPILRTKPESYFQEREATSAERSRLSIEAAIVTALFMLWTSARSAYGDIALFLFGRGHPNGFPKVCSESLSQRAVQWLHWCISIRRLNISRFLIPEARTHQNTEGWHFEAKMERYCIRNCQRTTALNNVVHKDADTDGMDWSYVLIELPWFSSRFHRVNCRWMRSILSKSSTSNEFTKKSQLIDDEFYLVVGETKLLAHKSIVSARSGKLAAHIRFVECHADESSNGARISVRVDLPLLAAMMVLSHCYHGSIALGLMKLPVKQCNQLLEMTIIAEEYLCPSLLLECELRLLMHKSYLEKYDYNTCICMQCSGGTISSKENLDIHNDSERINNGDDKSSYCEYAGHATITSAKTSIDSAGLVTPENCLDILAMAQQLEQSSCCQREIYGLNYCCSSGTNDCFKSTSSCGGTSIEEKVVAADTECRCIILVPFAAAKMMAVSMMLRNFSAVIRSKSYLHQISCDGDVNENDLDEVDAAFTKQPDAGPDNLAIRLLQTCLEELARSPYLYKH